MTPTMERMAGALDQLVPIVGVVVGAALSYVAGALNERARERRERAAKLDEHRLQAYAAYGQAVKAVASMAARVAAAQGLNTHMRAIDPDVGLAELDRLAVEREIRWEHVLLLGDPGVVEAAREWHRSIWHLEWLARGMAQDQSPAGWEGAVAESTTARDNFYRLARRDIGQDGPLPAAQWPPRWMSRQQDAPHDQE